MFSQMRGLLMRSLVAFTLISAVGMEARQTPVSSGSENIVYVPVLVDVSVGAPVSNDEFGGFGWDPSSWRVNTLLGLTPSNFRIYEDGVRQTIVSMTPTMTPGPVGIVVGLSSRGPAKAPVQQDAVFASVTRMVEMLYSQPGSGSFVDSTSWNSDGIYDAVTRSLVRLQRQADPRKVLFVISDGAIPGGANADDMPAAANLIEAARNVDFPVYFLSVGWGRGSAYSVSKTLRQLAESTGGEVVVANPHVLGSLDTVAAQLLDKVHRRYVIGYHSTNRTGEGKWRKIAVKVDPPPRTRKITVDLMKKQYFDGPVLTPANPAPAAATTSTLFPPERFPDKSSLVRIIDLEGNRIGDPSRLLSVATPAAGVVFPGASTVLESRWTGDWRTIEYVTEAYTAFGGFGGAAIVRTVSQIEKPGRVRIEIEVRAGKGAGRMLTVVSDGEATWIYNAANNEYARLTGSPLVALLSNLDELVLRQLPDALNIGQSAVGRNMDVFANFKELRDPLFALGWRGDPTILRAETLQIGGSTRDCWVITGNVGGLDSSYSTRVFWIDKDLQIPLTIGMVRGRLSVPNRDVPLFEQPHFYEIKVVSMKVNDPIPAATFTFKPPRGAREVSARPR
jgi:hypothetical protein